MLMRVMLRQKMLETFSRSAWLIVCVLLATGCAEELGPREAFRAELQRDVDELVERLQTYQPGTEKRERTVVTASGSRTSEANVPRAVIIGNRIESLGKRFATVSMEFLSEDIAGFDAWAALLKADVEEHKARIAGATEYLKERVERNPDHFRKGISNSENYFGRGEGAPDLYSEAGSIFGLQSIHIDAEGEIFFYPYGDQTGYSPLGLFQFDMDEWLTQVKSQSAIYQPPTS